MAAPDFTELYNTPLADADEAEFRKWLKKEGRQRDLADYDLRGWWKENGGQSTKKGHMTDQFKKPSHPTFSTESQYSGKDGNEGGTWRQAGEKWSFEPGPTNHQYYSRKDMTRYFTKQEKGVNLVLPPLADTFYGAR